MKLPEAADLKAAPALAEQLPKALAESSGTWCIDASALKSFDSSTIALLLQARRLAIKAQRPIEIFGVPDQLVRLAKLYGIDGLLPLAGAPAPSAASATGSGSAVAT